jgi:hypothetical protein
VGEPQHVVLVDAEERIDVQDLRDRRLADADGADLCGFDQADLALRTQRARQQRGRQPAGGTTAHDHHAPDRGSAHAGRLRLRENPDNLPIPVSSP